MNFGPYKPIPPSKPVGSFVKRECKEKTIGSYESISVRDLVADGVESFEVGYTTGYNDEVEMILYLCGESKLVPNENYAAEMETYKKLQRAYLDKVKEWKKEKLIYEAKEKEKQMAHARREVERLKKVLGETCE